MLFFILPHIISKIVEIIVEDAFLTFIQKQDIQLVVSHPVLEMKSKSDLNQDSLIVKREEIDDSVNQNQNRRFSKEEGTVMARNIRMARETRNRKAKYICPNHMEKYLFRCEFEGCSSPYICPNGQCLYEHFHTDHLILTKFDSKQFKKNYMKAQQIINNTQTMFIKAKQIKNVIDQFKGKLAGLFQDLSTMTVVCQGLKNQMDTSLNHAYLGKIDEVTNLQTKIMKTLEGIRSKIIISDQPRDQFYMKEQVYDFLEANVVNFKQGTAKELYKLTNDYRYQPSFHSVLQGRANLIFLFISEGMIIGSYFAKPYPTQKDNYVQDSASFVFLTDQQSPQRIIKFLANPDSSHHLEIAPDLMISQGCCNDNGVGGGLRVTADHIDTAEYAFPCSSYLPERQNQKFYTNSMKWDMIMVLQVTKED